MRNIKRDKDEEGARRMNKFTCDRCGRVAKSLITAMTSSEMICETCNDVSWGFDEPSLGDAMEPADFN